MRTGGLYFPNKVMQYFDSLQDRDSALRANECARRVAVEMQVMWSHISRLSLKSILDIGCGVAAIDALIAKEAGTEHIHLMDGTGDLSRKTGYKEGTLAWADVLIGYEMVRENVARGVEIRTHKPDPEATIPVDFIISLRSWGHHYPVSTYLALAQRSLKPGGGLLLDIRTGTQGAKQLMDAGFTLVTRIPDPSEKCRRLLFVKAWA